MVVVRHTYVELVEERLMKYEVTWTKVRFPDREAKAVFTVEARDEQSAISFCDEWLRGTAMAEDGRGPTWECNMVNTVKV